MILRDTKRFFLSWDWVRRDLVLTSPNRAKSEQRNIDLLSALCERGKKFCLLWKFFKTSFFGGGWSIPYLARLLYIIGKEEFLLELFQLKDDEGLLRH